MRTPHVRNVEPMIAKRRALANEVNETKAIQTLIKLGWKPTVTEKGMTLTEPPQRASVKTPFDA